MRVTSVNTRKKAVVEDWTTVPGWDGAKQEYVELDCERWIRENKIRELGQENGKQEFPPSDATQADDVYTKILAWVNQRGKTCHAEVSRHIVDQRHALELETKEGMAPIQDTVKSLRDRGIVELTDQAKQDRSILTQKEREAREAWAALAVFKAKAKLERVAEYNEIGKWYWWLIGIVVIEAFFNMFMLYEVHQYGAAGALVTMLMIGVVNAVIPGLLVGEGWRQKNSVEFMPKMGGIVMLVLGLMVMVSWNLLVGHFRDSMLSVATKAAFGASSLEELLTDDTLDRFLNKPLGLEGMLSWVLVAFGVGCCILAAWKWLTRDDVYPGYGAVHRTATEHSKEYVQEMEQRLKVLKSIYTTYIDKIRDERQKLENKKGNHRLITDTAKGIVRQFPMQLRQYQDHLDFIIAAYRSANEKARTTPNPKFFAERLLIDQDMLEAPEWEAIEQSDYDEDWEGFQQAEDAIRKSYQDAQAGYPTLENLMESENSEERLEQ